MVERRRLALDRAQKRINFFRHRLHRFSGGTSLSGDIGLSNGQHLRLSGGNCLSE